MSFNNKVAIVTGAGQGIGEGYAKALAAKGAAVVVAEINAEQGERVAGEINSSGGRAAFVRVDVSDEESTKAMAKAAADTFGGIDYLVNNAAIFLGMDLTPMLEVDMAYYNKFMAVNMTGCLLTTRAVTPYMVKRGGGAIVNQTSTAAWMSSGAYSVAKLAMNGLTCSLARELGPRNIRINGIAPGPTETAALRSVVRDDQLQGLLMTMPIARLGTPADLADPLMFLLSDEARWITGHILNVDGGQYMRV